jgi:hypothetical protein
MPSLERKDIVESSVFMRLGYDDLPNFFASLPILQDDFRQIRRIIQSDKRHLVLDDLGCYGRARLMVKALGRKARARIWEVEFKYPDHSEGHAYVIPNDLSSSSRPLNDIGVKKFTIDQIRQIGKDVTGWTFQQKWEDLF